MDVSKLFFKLAKDGRISREGLIALGAKNDWIEGAIEENVLRETTEGFYVPGEIADMIEYGRYMLEDTEDKPSDPKAAFSIFNYVYTNHFENFEINLQLLYFEMKSYDPSEGHVFKYFKVVYDTLVKENRDYDANYYLLLIASLINFCPKDETKSNQFFNTYGKKFIELKEEDILVPEEEENATLENLLRKGLIDNKYYDVKNCFDLVFPFDEENELEPVFKRLLVSKWLEAKKDVNKKLASCLSKDDFEEARNILNEASERRCLSQTNEAILKMVNTYITIRDKKVIPTPRYEGVDIFEAIKGNNFTLAAKLEEERIINHNITKGTYLYTMLKKLLKLIDTVISCKRNGVELPVNKVVYEKTSLLKEGSSSTGTDEIANIIIGLMEADNMSLEEACKSLNMDEERINYYKLIYARDCYYHGNVTEGDKYLEQVNKVKDRLKNRGLNELFDEINENKKDYPYRYENEKDKVVFLKQ